MTNKKGFAGFFAFVMALLILGVLAVGVIFFKVDAELFFDINEVTRFQGCDITLLNVLRAEVVDSNGNGLGYDYAEAIGTNGVSSVKSNIEGLIEPIFKDKTVDFEEQTCIALGISNCCSQIVPKFDGTGYMEVSLVDRT
jgi:hypothetical protein